MSFKYTVIAFVRSRETILATPIDVRSRETTLATPIEQTPSYHLSRSTPSAGFYRTNPYGSAGLT